MSKKIVTNLRIDKTDWLQIKAIAAELAMSTNEYLNFIAKNAVSKAQFGYPKKSKIKKGKSIYDLLSNLSKQKYHRKTFGLSEDDKSIYGS